MKLYLETDYGLQNPVNEISSRLFVYLIDTLKCYAKHEVICVIKFIKVSLTCVYLVIGFKSVSTFNNQ